MNIKTAIAGLKRQVSLVDWKLLIFLLLFLNVKLWVKLVAIVLSFVLRPGFSFGFRAKNSRLPLFYISVIGIAIINWLISGKIVEINYGLVLLSGISFWCLCLLGIQQVKLSVEQNDPSVIHRTILVFFIINALASLFVYAAIILETGHINPYLYQGDFQKYFIGTGDYIKGITLDTSTTNAVLNAFGIIYYLVRKKYIMVLLCMVILLLTGSNVTNLLLIFVLLYLFIFRTNKEQKSIIIVCMMLLTIFLTKVSPQNNKYIKNIYNRLSKEIPKEKPVYLNTTSIADLPDSILNAEERKQKIAQIYLDSVKGIMVKNKTNIVIPEHPGIIYKTEYHPVTHAVNVTPTVVVTEKPVIPKDSIHTRTFQYRNDTTATEKQLLKFIDSERKEMPIAASRKQDLHIPGKLIALKQTLQYLGQHPQLLFTGTGMGNFSSKLAFRATGMKVAGGYPEKYVYINEAFKTNHLDLYLFYFTSPRDLQSIANSPNSTYDQLLSEYGLAGIFSFAFLYIAFFLKRIRWKEYAMPLLLFMLGTFFIEYWFEQLSVVVFFELLLFLNIRETTLEKDHEAH